MTSNRGVLRTEGEKNLRLLVQAPPLRLRRTQADARRFFQSGLTDGLGDKCADELLDLLGTTARANKLSLFMLSQRQGNGEYLFTAFALILV